jgi:hypothetical protein
MERGGRRSSRPATWAAVAAIGLAAAAVAATSFSIAGHWHGVFVLRGKGGALLEVKDDLFLGDGSRLVAGVSFSRMRRLLSSSGAATEETPALELEWDERSGSGLVRNRFGDGTELVTLFGRYEDSDGHAPQGLFVGGALPDVAADDALQNESGMTYRDARGWHHVWCNVNEGLYDHASNRFVYPSAWRFLGSRVLIRDRDRVVLESSHEALIAGVPLRVDRFAYFRAGKPWFKLGIRVLNAGERQVRYTYAYGDEPWVGEFGSARGNVGWTADGVVRVEGPLDPARHRWAGIFDEDSDVANFVSWVGGDLPDLVFFSNHPGAQGAILGTPLDSNEVFVGLQWNERALAPGEDRSMLLSFGLAGIDGAGKPVIPEGAGPP